MKKNNFRRHGDLNFHEISKEEFESLKKNGVKKEGDKFILQEGETTGHKHVLSKSKEDIDIVQLPDGRWVFEVKDAASITHEDHKKIDLSPGYYVLEREREVDHFSESIVRQVID